MRTSSSGFSLTGTSLGFDRSGRHVLVIEADGIAVIDVAGARTLRLPVRDAQAIAGFDDQLWIVARDGELTRCDPAGQPLGAPLPLPFAPRAVLVAAPCGPAAAAWSVAPPIGLVDEGGPLVRIEHPRADLVLPIAGRRAATVAGSRLTLPSGQVTQLAPNATVLGGAVMADGKRLALLLASTGARGGERHLVVVSLTTAQVVLRCAIQSTDVRIATERGLAIAQLEPRVLWGVDLRSGRELGAIELDRDVVEHAVDPAGQWLAVRNATGEVELLNLADAVRSAAAIGTIPAPRAVERADAAPAAAVPVAFTRSHRVAAGAPRPAPAPAAIAPPRATPVVAAREADDQDDMVGMFPCDAVAVDAQSARRPVVTAEWLSRDWLDAEIERIWLSAETELRRLQQLQLRPAIPEVDAVLAERRAGRAGKPSPFDAGELGRALDSVQRQLEALRPPAEDLLQRRLGLSPCDVAGLLIVAAPSIDPPLADLLAAVRGPVLGRRGVDLAMMGQLLALGRERRIDLLDLLDEQRPPVAHRLIQVAPAQDAYSSASYRSILPTLDLLWLLTTAGDAASPSLRGCASLVRSPASWDGLVLDGELRTALDALAARFSQATALPWIALWGAPGSGKREIASRLAACAGRPLLSVDPRTGDAAQTLDVVRRACRDAAWMGAALYLGPFGAEDLHDQPVIARELERCTAPLLLGFDGLVAPRLKTTMPLVERALPIPQVPGRVALWNRALAGLALAPGADVAAIARGYKLTPGEILDAGREVASLAGPGTVDRALLRRVMERRLRNELGAVATRLVVETSWNDVVLPAEASGRVRELISRKHQEDRVYREWGLDRRIGHGKGIIALFSGPPGTGKTLLAGLIARELGYELYQIDLSQVFSRWIGETEKALARVFDQAERAHAVLLFDEADALFARRTEVDDSNDRYANAAVNFLLQRLERYSGVAVLTTNKDSQLDEALRRRLNLHLRLEEPDPAERLALWQKHLPMSVPGAATVDLVGLARDYELTGGYIKNVAVRATFLSAAENVPLTTQQIRRAAALELEDLGRVVTWPTEPDDREGMIRWPAPIEVVDYVAG